MPILYPSLPVLWFCQANSTGGKLARAYVPVTLDVALAIEKNCL